MNDVRCMEIPSVRLGCCGTVYCCATQKLQSHEAVAGVGTRAVTGGGAHCTHLPRPGPIPHYFRVGKPGFAVRAGVVLVAAAAGSEMSTCELAAWRSDA